DLYPPTALHDLPHEARIVTGGAQHVQCGEGIPARHDREHSEPKVEDVLHLAVVDVGGALDLGEDARLVPRASPHHRVAVVREHAGEVGTDAAAGDVRERVHVDPAPEVAQR